MPHLLFSANLEWCINQHVAEFANLATHVTVSPNSRNTVFPLTVVNSTSLQVRKDTSVFL
jgi:hypothetical protein